MRTSGITASSILIAILAPAICFSAPVFQSEFPPGEGPFLYVVRREAPIYTNPDLKSPIVKSDGVKKGEILGHLAGRLYQTISAGIVVVNQPYKVRGHSFGEINFLTTTSSSTLKDFSFTAGQKLEYLQYRSEGSCIMRIGNEIAEVPEPDGKYSSFLKKAVNQWWVPVLGNFESVRGWALVDGQSIARKPQ